MRTHVTAAVVLSLALAALAAPPSAHAQPAGPELNRIVDQGMAHSEVLRIAAYLTDVIGGRLTNSPQMRVAEAWTIDLFRRWGLRNVRKDGFAFGRGWSYSAVSARMLTPRVVPLHERGVLRARAYVGERDLGRIAPGTVWASISTRRPMSWAATTPRFRRACAFPSSRCCVSMANAASGWKTSST